MYQVYIDKPSYFEAEMAAEFKDLEISRKTSVLQSLPRNPH